MSNTQDTAAATAPGPDAGRDRQARDVRNTWWVLVPDAQGVTRWRLVVDVQFPRAASSGMRRLIVCADGTEAELGARDVMRAMNPLELKRAGLTGVDPGSLA